MYGLCRQEWVNQVYSILSWMRVTSSRLEFLVEDAHRQGDSFDGEKVVMGLVFLEKIL